MRIILALFLLVNIAQAKFKWGYQLGAYSPIVSLWHLNTGVNGTTYDTSGKNYNGTITGAVWCSGLWEKCLSFDGIDDYVRIQGTPITNAIANGFTVSYWFKPQNTFDSSASEDMAIVVEGGNPGAGGANPMGRLKEATGKLRAYWWQWRGVYSNRTSWIGGEWYHIVVRQVPNGQIYLYVNGVDDSGDRDIWDEEDRGTHGNWYFGGNVSYDTNYFNGHIEEVIIYNRALSPAEIKFLYQSQSGRYK